MNQHFRLSPYSVMRSLYCIIFFATVILNCSANASAAVSPIAINTKDSNQPPAETVTDAEKQPKPEERHLSDLIPKATDLSKALIEMEAELTALQDTSKTQDRLLEFSQEKNQLQEQLHTLLIDPQGRVQQLTSLQSMLQEIIRKVSTTAENQDKSIAVLDTWIDFWSKEKKDLTQWETGLGASSSLPEVQVVLDRLQNTVEQAEKTINTELLPLLELQEKTGHLQVEIHKLHLRMQNLFENTFQQKIYQHAPFLLSADFINQFNKALLKRTIDGIQQAFHPDIRFLKKEKLKFSAALILFTILLATFYSNKKSLAASARWDFFHQRPISVAFFISMFLFFIVSNKLPVFWLTISRALILISTIRISRVIITNKLQKNFVTRLAILLLATNLISLINLPMPMVRMYVICVSLSLILFSISQLIAIKETIKKPAWLTWAKGIGTLSLIIILFAEINGRAELAYFVFVASLKTLFAGLLVWILYLIILVLLEMVLHYAPLPLLQKNRKPIMAMIQPLLVIGALLLLMGEALVDWRLFPTSTDTITYISHLGVTFGESRVSLGLLSAASFLLYSAYCISKILQSILLHSVLPHKNVDKGVQHSITTLLHYSIMLIGFLLALQALGFSLTNLTILGGALGLGIGFGLQAIINNFASGLILLFERPIKVGDTIQIGEELAEVKELGLRATIVQTPDNAKIVVPNSDLVTSQVTNWTLQERRTRIKIPVGVAYGSDVEMVLRILLECAEERPEILNTPKPSALFLAFGASSLDFELRVFIPEFTNRRQVQSELNVDINREFTDAGIEIPFPQNDLHIRSIDAATADKISGKTSDHLDRSD